LGRKKCIGQKLFANRFSRIAHKATCQRLGLFIFLVSIWILACNPFIYVGESHAGNLPRRIFICNLFMARFSHCVNAYSGNKIFWRKRNVFIPRFWSAYSKAQPHRAACIQLSAIVVQNAIFGLGVFKHFTSLCRVGKTKTTALIFAFNYFCFFPERKLASDKHERCASLVFIFAFNIHSFIYVHSPFYSRVKYSLIYHKLYIYLCQISTKHPPYIVTNTFDLPNYICSFLHPMAFAILGKLLNTCTAPTRFVVFIRLALQLPIIMYSCTWLGTEKLCRW